MRLRQRRGGSAAPSGDAAFGPETIRGLDLTSGSEPDWESGLLDPPFTHEFKSTM